MTSSKDTKRAGTHPGGVAARTGRSPQARSDRRNRGDWAALAAFTRQAAATALLAIGSVGLGSVALGQQAGSAGHARSGAIDPDDCPSASASSPYVPVDSWVYAALMRLYSLGYVDTAFLGLRPWTRSSMRQMLELAGEALEDASEDRDAEIDQARRLYAALSEELSADRPSGPCAAPWTGYRLESAYTMARGVEGIPLRDSYHLGSTIVNDFGRPYARGLGSYSGLSGYASAGRFTAYARGELQADGSGPGYTIGLARMLSTIDGTSYADPSTGMPYPQATIPQGEIGAAANARLVEAYLSAAYLNHQVSFGKCDAWLGPGAGGAMAYSNNAENIYAFRIDRMAPLEIPLLSQITGPFRYEFLVGALRGHTFMPNPAYAAGSGAPNAINPGDPWVHVEKISFKPTANIEFGFERTVIWGGKGHAPITVGSFLRSFFSFSAPSPAVKGGRDDPGARFGAFDFVYRLPYLRNLVTLYADSEVHDDVSPVSSPQRAGWRPGIYLSRVPGLAGLDVRAEAATTDTPVSNSPQFGHYMYWETIERQGYTNQGQLFGDWIGREDKGGQAWVTYHLSGNEWIQAELRMQKATSAFLPGGTTLGDLGVRALKRLGKEVEIDAGFSLERWKAPIYPSGVPEYPAAAHTAATTFMQVTWFPRSMGNRLVGGARLDR